MDSASQDLYCQKLNELVYDEDKIVTCTSAASSLKIPLREAKDLLSKYVADHRQVKPEELSVTYLLSGVLKSGDLAVYFVKEDDLGHKKLMFKTVASEVLYSVQKSKNIDFNVVSLADKVDVELGPTALPGSIVGKNCVKRNIRIKKLPIPQPKPVKESRSFFTKLPPKTENKQNDAKPGTSKETNEDKPAEKQGASRGAPPKQQSKPKPAGGIASFLAKVPPKKVVKKEEEAVKLEDKIKIEEDNSGSEEKMNDDIVIESSFKEEEKMEVDDVKPAEKQPEKGNSKKRRKKNKNNEMPNKRRKRIQENFDSDSSDMFGDEENEDIIEKSDEEPEPPAIIKSPLMPKNKRRKAVDRTYVDEDGYIVTKTEYVLESASEDEKEVPPAKAEEKPKPAFGKKNGTTDSENEIKGASKGKKNKKPVSGKQPTLMSFFKRT